MGNFCSIHHLKFDRLYELTNNYNKATLLDKLIYWWQISKYTLNDNKIWFTKTIRQIASDSKISTRSVSRYLEEFETQGLIERTNKLFIKKHLYIRITDKLIAFLNTTAQKEVIKPLGLEGQGEKTINHERLFLAQHGTIDNATMAVSIYKDQDNKISVNNNTVSNYLFVDNSKKQEHPHALYPNYKIETVIGDRLSIREKNYIKGMILNLQKQHGLSFSNPEMLFSEIAFTLLQPEQLQGITNFNHRIQIIAKLLRQKSWRTPKGFFNHSDFGAAFKNLNLHSEERKIQPKTNKIHLEQEKKQLTSLFNENAQLISSDLVSLKETIGRLKNRPSAIVLINSLTHSLLQFHHQQLALINDIKTLDERIQQNSFVPEHRLIQEKARQLTLLRHLEGQIRQLAHETFDVFCDGHTMNCNAKEVETTYSRYEQFMQLLGDVEKLITQREERFDDAYAA